jgi:hypothetical protein
MYWTLINPVVASARVYRATTLKSTEMSPLFSPYSTSNRGYIKIVLVSFLPIYPRRYSLGVDVNLITFPKQAECPMDGTSKKKEKK